MKKIVFTVIDNGMDGRQKDSIRYASFDEEKRDKSFENNKHKCYFRKSEEIVDIEETEKTAKQKLNAIDKLVLDIKG